MIAHKEVKDFWKELKRKNKKFFTKPDLCWKDEAIYKIQTKEDYTFEDSFWDIFHKYPFHICHINYGCKGNDNKYEIRFRVEKVKKNI